MGLFFTLITVSSALLTAYPQHIYINEETRIESLKFLENNTVLLKGNQVSYGTGDVIPVKGRDYIRITGNQIQIGEKDFREGVRAVTASYSQNVLFMQKIGSVPGNRPFQIVVDNSILNIIPINSTIYNINAAVVGKTGSNSYNVQFVQETVYINENSVMYKLSITGETISVHLVGFDRHKTILVRAM